MRSIARQPGGAPAHVFKVAALGDEGLCDVFGRCEEEDGLVVRVDLKNVVACHPV